MNGHFEVKPFDLTDMISIFKEMDWIKEEKEVLKYYLIFGGFVKHYLDISNKINFKFPLDKNLQELKKNSFFFRAEFDAMFRGVLSDKKQYKEIVEIIANKGTANVKEVLESLKIKKDTSYIRTQMGELENEGFLKSYKVKNESVFFISIPLMFFHGKWEEEDFNLLDSGLFYVWQGRAFELFLANNVDKIIENLKFKGKHKFFFNRIIRNSDFSPNGDEKIVAQIDILFKKEKRRKSKIRNWDFELIECKFFEKGATWGKVEENNLKQKKDLLKEVYIKRNKKREEINTVNINTYILTTVNATGLINILDWF